MTETMTPELRSDIRIQKHKEYGGIIFDTAHSFHLSISENLLVLIHLINGVNCIKTIQERYNSIYKTNISIEKIKHIVYNQLGNKIIIQKNSTKESIEKNSYIKKSINLIPTTNIYFITRNLSHLFQWHGIALFFILFSITLYYTNNPLQVNYTLTLHQIPVYICLLTGCTFMHEVGHITACRYYQINSNGIGAGLYMYIIPVIFSDVSGIWLLNKKERIIVNLSGVYFEIMSIFFIYCACHIVSVQEYDSLLFILLLRSFLNLVPLSKSDGYWIVNDLFSFRNLHQSSKKAIQQLLNKQQRNKRNLLLSLYYILNKGILAYLIYQILIKKNVLIYSILPIGSDVTNNELSINYTDILKIILLFIIIINYIINVYRERIKKYRHEKHRR